MNRAISAAGLLILMVGLVGTGCQQSNGADTNGGASGAGDPYAEPASLSAAENGGYDANDEAPYFGLESMSQFGPDTPVSDPSFAALEALEGEQVYTLRIVWGNLELDARHDLEAAEGTSDLLDWSGTLTLDGGGELHLIRTIAFDLHDSIVTEDDPKLVQWISHTGPHVDGIVVKVIYLPDPEIADPTITFQAGPVTQVIPLSELDHYDQIVTIDSDGHGAAFTALRTDDDTCLEGFLDGKWHKRLEGEGGVFRGRVMDDESGLIGHLRGHFGVDHDGGPVFFGKYIDLDGHFRGFLHGTYGDGAFAGDWTAADGSLEGSLNAEYVTGETVDSGFFQGFWQQDCQ
jgi:hypothetical protein